MFTNRDGFWFPCKPPCLTKVKRSRRKESRFANPSTDKERRKTYGRYVRVVFGGSFKETGRVA